MTTRGATTYQVQQVMTASPMMLIAMLYDKAIQSLKEAILAIEAGNIQGRWRANNRAFQIIQHLQMTLDVEHGGEIASNLDRLYSLMLRILPQVDMKNDPQPAREVIKLLEPLRRAWHEAAAGGATSKVASDATSDFESLPQRTIVSA